MGKLISIGGWDARLTSELILLFLYVGFIALQSAIDDPRWR